MSEGKNPTALANTPTRRQVIASVPITFSGLVLGSTEVWAKIEERFLVRRNPFIKNPFSKRAESVSTKHSLTPNSSTRSRSSVPSCTPACRSERHQRKSAVRWEGRSHFLVAISWDDTSSSCRTSESFKLGAW